MRTLVLLLERTELASRALVHSVVARPRPGRRRGSLPLSALLRQHPPPLPLWARRRNRGAELPGHDGPPSRVEKSVEPCRTPCRLFYRSSTKVNPRNFIGQILVSLTFVLVSRTTAKKTRRVIFAARTSATSAIFWRCPRKPFWRGLSQARSLEGRARGRVPGLTRWRRNEAKRP